MRKLALAVAAVAAFSAAPASASVTVNYTITGTGTGGIILTCSDTFSACSLDYLLLYSLPGFPTSFSTANAGLLQSLSGVTIGGTTGGVNGIDLPSNADDFLFTFAPDVASQTVSLTYVSGLAEQIFPSFGELTITQVQSPGTPAVPEPATWAMMLLGFGALGLSLRRKSSRLESAFHPNLPSDFYPLRTLKLAADAPVVHSDETETASPQVLPGSPGAKGTYSRRSSRRCQYLQVLPD